MRIFVGVQFRLFPHSIDFVLAQTAAVCNFDALFTSSSFVTGRDFENAIGVNFKAHLDLRHPTRRRGNPRELELPETFVIPSHRPFPLERMDFHRGLTVGGSREGLSPAAGNGGVALDDFGEDFAQGFDAQRERRHIKQQDILHFTAQDPSLNGRA